jgi:hypothetical protein
MRVLLAVSAVSFAMSGLPDQTPAGHAASTSEACVSAPSDEYEGRVAAITKDSIALLGDRGRSSTFLLTAESRITINGKPASWQDVGVGQAAQIVAVNGGAGLLAKRVVIHWIR